MRLIHLLVCLVRQVFSAIVLVKQPFRLPTAAQPDTSAIQNQLLPLKLRAQKDICVPQDQHINKFALQVLTNPSRSKRLVILALQDTIVMVLIPARQSSVHEVTIALLVFWSEQNTQTSIPVQRVLSGLLPAYQLQVNALLAQADTIASSKHKVVKLLKFSLDITLTI